jgi:hypothetical protein
MRCFGRFFTLGAEPHLDLSALQRPACAAPGRVYTQGPQLHLELSGQQELVLFLGVSTPEGPKQYQDVS